MLSVPRAQQHPQSANARGSLTSFKHTACYSKFVNCGRGRWNKLPLLPQMQSVHTKKGHASKCGARACTAVDEGDNKDDESLQFKGITLGLQINSYPWAKFTTKLMHHAADAVWFVGKWIAVPALILMTFREVVFAVASENELWVPIGLLVGTLCTGILKETFSTLGIDFQDNVLPWHLLELGLFFGIVKVGASLVVPICFRVFLYHFSTGGLWQTIRFCLEWRAKHEQGVHEEMSSLSV